MNIIKIYKYQLFLYGFIILFTLQNALFLSFNASLNLTKKLLNLFYYFSINCVSFSYHTYYPSSKSINRKSRLERKYVLAC